MRAQVVHPEQVIAVQQIESRLAQDNFPALGMIDLVDLGRNDVRFDMAQNISPPSTGPPPQLGKNVETR